MAYRCRRTLGFLLRPVAFNDTSSHDGNNRAGSIRDGTSRDGSSGNDCSRSTSIELQPRLK